MAKYSTGLRNGMLGDSSLKDLLAGGSIKIYAGTIPASADDAIGSATLLVTVGADGASDGLDFGTPTNGVISKDAGQAWSGVNANSGTAAFFRHVAPGDDGTASTTAPRIQGSVALAGGDINISALGLTALATQTLNSYNVALPTL